MTSKEFHQIVDLMSTLGRGELSEDQKRGFWTVLKDYPLGQVLTKMNEFLREEESRFRLPRPIDLIPEGPAKPPLRLGCPYCRKVFEVKDICIRDPEGKSSSGYYDRTEGRWILPTFQAHLSECDRRTGVYDLSSDKLQRLHDRLQADIARLPDVCGPMLAICQDELQRRQP